MRTKTPCPDARRLEGLLHDNLPPPEQAVLTEHVGDCAACQRELDRLAAGPESGQLRDVQSTRPATDSAYWSAVKRLEKDLTRELPRGIPSDEKPTRPAVLADVTLDFLSPSADPAHLGMLDNFAILGVVGRGGMGLVLRGRDTWLDREVAV